MNSFFLFVDITNSLSINTKLGRLVVADIPAQSLSNIFIFSLSLITDCTLGLRAQRTYTMLWGHHCNIKLEFWRQTMKICNEYWEVFAMGRWTSPVKGLVVYQLIHKLVCIGPLIFFSTVTAKNVHQSKSWKLKGRKLNRKMLRTDCICFLIIWKRDKNSVSVRQCGIMKGTTERESEDLGFSPGSAFTTVWHWVHWFASPNHSVYSY